MENVHNTNFRLENQMFTDRSIVYNFELLVAGYGTKSGTNIVCLKQLTQDHL